MFSGIGKLSKKSGEIAALLGIFILTHTWVVAEEDLNVESQFQTTARILGTIPDGTPPPPAPAKPSFVVPGKNIIETKRHQQGGRTVTIREIKPIDLPPPPPPPAPVAAAPEADFAAKVAAYDKAHPANELLFLGATVYRSKNSPPRTLVRYWPQGNRESVSFFSSADFAIIAGGINSFVDSAGVTHHLIMGWGSVDIEQLSDLRAAAGIEYEAPEIPDFPAGDASFAIIGQTPTAESLLQIQSLHDLYNANISGLTTAYQGREQARLAREAELKANPPQPEDITINYWRSEKPAPARKETAR